MRQRTVSIWNGSQTTHRARGAEGSFRADRRRRPGAERERAGGEDRGGDRGCAAAGAGRAMGSAEVDAFASEAEALNTLRAGHPRHERPAERADSRRLETVQARSRLARWPIRARFGRGAARGAAERVTLCTGPALLRRSSCADSLEKPAADSPRSERNAASFRRRPGYEPQRFLVRSIHWKRACDQDVTAPWYRCRGRSITGRGRRRRHLSAISGRSNAARTFA